MSGQTLDLRAVVADVVRDVVAELAADTVRQQLSAPAPASEAVSSHDAATTTVTSPGTPGAEYVTSPPHQRERTETVRIGDDADLDRFVRHLVSLFENPKNRQDLRAGRLRFRLQGGTTAQAPSQLPAQRFDSGPVTERHVRATAESGRRLILGRKAVLTPLARDKARALGVSIEKER